jgi:hypothetical protein
MLAGAAQLGSGQIVSSAGTQAAGIQYAKGFAHIAFGTMNAERTSYWKTTFVFRNEMSTDATITLRFFGDAGQELIVPVVGASRSSQLTFALPGGGSREIVLDPSGDPLTVGWAAADYLNVGIKAQGIFTEHLASGFESEAVVNMVSQVSEVCIYPLPGVSTGYSLPFDNADGRVSSYALANTTTSSVTVHARFYGPDNESLGEITQDIPALGHVAFASTDRLPVVSGKKGTMRLEGAGVIPLGFRFNPNNPVIGDARTFTTWLEK